MRRLAIIVALASCSLLADTVRLKDGTTITGTIRRADKAYEVTESSGVVRTVNEDQVASIERGAGGATPADAAARLTSHRRAVENLSDIDQILARYDAMVRQIEGTPAADEARKDIARWRDYKAKGMVRVGKDWLSPDDLSKLEEQHFIAVDQARGLIKQNRTKEALAAVEKVLEREPDNVGALYLKGLCLFKQDQVLPARRAFEQAAGILPTHGPTLNNLAVTQWRQNQQSAAMGNYLKAMLAMPMNATIHNNVAEALNNLARDQRDSVAARKLSAQYTRDEPQLQATMQQSGLYRWGSTWVTDTQLRDLREQERQVRDRLDSLARDFEDTQDAVESIDEEIGRNERAMTALENSTYMQDAQGNWIRLPTPQRWYDTRNDNERLKTRRKQLLDRLDRIQGEAESTRARMAVPPYTNQHKLLDEEQTPTRLRAAMTTAAAVNVPAAPAALPAPSPAAVPAPPATQPASPGPVRAEPAPAAR